MTPPTTPNTHHQQLSTVDLLWQDAGAGTWSLPWIAVWLLDLMVSLVLVAVSVSTGAGVW